MAEIADFRLPDLGEGLEEGEIVAWHVEVGDLVELNQVVADLETATALVEVPSPFAGRVVERVGDLGESLPVGTVILRIDVAVTTSVPGFRGRQPGEVEPVRGIRRRIVDKMEVSRREIPAASCSRDADLTEAWELRHHLTALAREQGLEVKITPLALVLRAVVVALRRFPTLNARMHGRGPDGDGEIQLLEPIHLGVATDTDRGLVVPVIHDAHQRSLLDLAQQTAALAGRAREGTISPGELTGGTFTVNNYGPFGIDAGEPIINHPEGAILGVGAIRERPWVVDGELTMRRIARFTLVFDHRLSDGGKAGRFVSEVVELCERPGRLLLHL